MTLLAKFLPWLSVRLVNTEKVPHLQVVWRFGGTMAGGEEPGSRAKTPGRTPERSPRAKTSSPKSPGPSVLPPIKTSKPASRTNSNLVSPKYGDGNLCHNPVSPRTPKEMTGSAIERATGIIYPYNMWGPCNPTKYGHLANVPPYLRQKEHYKGKHVTKLLLIPNGVHFVTLYEPVWL